MNKKVSITELMTETAVLTIGLTFSSYHWFDILLLVLGKNGLERILHVYSKCCRRRDHLFYFPDIIQNPEISQRTHR